MFSVRKIIPICVAVIIGGCASQDLQKPTTATPSEITAAMEKNQVGEVAKVKEQAASSLAEAKAANVEKTKMLEERYLDSEKHYLEFANAAPSHDQKWIDEHAKAIIDEFRFIEANAMKMAILQGPRKTIQAAKDNGAEEFAPKSLALAEQKIAETEKFILAAPEKRDEIKQRGKETAFYANRASQLTQASKVLSTQKPEEIALWVEGNLSDLETLVSVDERDKKFDDQLATIKDSIRDLKAGRAGLAQESQRLRSDVAKLNDQVTKEEPAAEFNRQYTTVSALFAPDEAQVIREGGKVILRLKSIQFPAGSATIKTDAYPLLAKVQKAIHVFGDDSKITIEGHTDSSGSAAKNKTLSANRAEAVKQYLVSAESIPEGKVTTVGYGFEKPITSDKTAEGRATNRRIDVLIEPGKDNSPNA